jgi:hypothetical protein
LLDYVDGSLIYVLESLFKNWEMGTDENLRLSAIIERLSVESIIMPSAWSKDLF